jgi:translocon-associated protein subunit alpha
VSSSQNGNYFSEAVFNQTIPIVEVDEGIDTEIFFLYVFLAALVVLLCVLGSQFFSWGKRKTIGSSKGSSVRSKSAVETGTRKKNDDVDFDWIPKEALARECQLLFFTSANIQQRN